MSIPAAPEPEPERAEPNTAPPKRAAWFRYTDASSVGIEIAVTVTLGAVGGLWLERNVTHWSPWTTLIGVALGLAAAARAVLRTARSYRRELATKDEAPEAAQDDARND